MRAALIICAALALAAPAYALADDPSAYPISTTSAGCQTAAGPIEPCPVTIEAPAPDPDVFLCYSRFQVDPGAWPTSQARDLLASGAYWSPFAESSSPTATYIGHGVYLACNGYTASGSVVGADGTNIGPAAWSTGLPGYYPAAA